MDSLRLDFRVALRLLAKNPAFTATVVLSLGLTLVAIVAAYPPARRAPRVNPLTALKAE